jgi:hypothetical protein
MGKCCQILVHAQTKIPTQYDPHGPDDPSSSGHIRT